MNSQKDFDVIVVGTGPTGLFTAGALARLGLDVALCGFFAPSIDMAQETRTVALLNSSIELLDANAAGVIVREQGAPLMGIRLVDDMGGLARAPEVLFRACDIDAQELGFNIPNAALVGALTDYVRDQSGCTAYDNVTVVAVEPGRRHISVQLDDGHALTAALVVGADGRRSVCRSGAGIGVRQWAYDQAAITTVFAHSRPHGSISTEFHRRVGPCTVVPFNGCESSLVWVETPSQANMLVELDDQSFADALESRLQGLLGSIKTVRRRQVFPLSGLLAQSFGMRRVAIVGEAAHAFPPIGAQGLNLGFRDCGALLSTVRQAMATGADIGGAACLGAYNRDRTADIPARTAGVDLLNRSLTSAILPVNLARGAALHAIAAVPALKAAFMRAGMAGGSRSQYVH